MTVNIKMKSDIPLGKTLSDHMGKKEERWIWFIMQWYNVGTLAFYLSSLDDI